MVNFVIVGKIDCPNFCHASHVAAYLEKNLPNFHVQKIVLDSYEWKTYILDTYKRYKWYHLSSPLIYKELLGYGGVPHLIGGLSEFWEYCYDYYGLESVLSKEELENLVEDNIKYYNADLNVGGDQKPRKILIYGPVSKFLYHLVTEMMKIKCLSSSKGIKGIEFKFYSDVFEYEENNYDDLIELLKDEYNTNAEQIDKLESICDCDLVIITGFHKKQNQSSMKYFIMMNHLGDEINHCARKHLKILFVNYGMSCYLASILAGKLESPNIAVVSSDHGLGPLNYVARAIDVDVGDLCGPPVWGFIGSSEIIDVSSIVKKCNVYKPYERAMRSDKNSTLVHGTVATEMRFINYLTDGVPKLYNDMKKAQEEAKSLMCRAPIYSKVNAAISLLRLWFSPVPSDEIVSVGVVSDGSYGIPSKLVFSQPATLINGVWTPFPDYPVPPNIKLKIDQAVVKALKVMNS